MVASLDLSPALLFPASLSFSSIPWSFSASLIFVQHPPIFFQLPLIFFSFFHNFFICPFDAVPLMQPLWYCPLTTFGDVVPWRPLVLSFGVVPWCCPLVSFDIVHLYVHWYCPLMLFLGTAPWSIPWSFPASSLLCMPLIFFQHPVLLLAFHLFQVSLGLF